VNAPHTKPPLTLEGTRVKLLPLAQEHSNAIKVLVQGGELQKIWYTSIPNPEQMDGEIKRRLGLQSIGSMIPFSVWDKERECFCGMTTYMHIDPQHPRLEIGSTWLAKDSQRRGINTEMKFLMLKHAFEDMGCIAVEFRTHFMNAQSRRAIERLGAKLDGILRSHQIMKDGSLRDTCVYSITRAEWPSVRSNLHHLQSQTYQSQGR
jgi:RimJ/RimL family protein N-acetyltransferase